jgi:2-methylisocitrate lyase-like PEP mutase family enzyme
MTASRFGHADLGIASLPDMRAHAEMIANLSPDVPLIADADTGYGGPIMVARTLDQYIRSGIAGLHIEDQVQTKRCGHLAGKQLVDIVTFITRIRAAHAARLRNSSDIVIIARTDALQSYGFEESINRLRAARDAGADVLFLEGVTSKEQARQTCEALAPSPALLNMVEHGATPIISTQEARDMGFKIMIVPFAALAPAYYAIKEVLERLKKTGLTGSSEEFTPQKLFRICGVEDSMRIDADAGAAAFAGGID